MTTTPRPISLQLLRRRRFGLLLPLGGMALLAACSKDPAPATTPTAPEPAATPAPTPAPAPAAAPDTTAPAAAPAPAGGGTAGLPMVDPADPVAKPLSYTADATQVVAASNPKHQAGQACGNCALFGGQPGDAAGPCPLFAGRQVSAKAWCNAYAKKAG